MQLIRLPKCIKHEAISQITLNDTDQVEKHTGKKNDAKF